MMNKGINISNKDLNNIIEIAKSLGESSLLLKGVGETVENEVKEQKGRFLGMLAATLASGLLEIRNMKSGEVVMRQGEGTFRAGQNILLVSHLLTKAKILSK